MIPSPISNVSPIAPGEVRLQLERVTVRYGGVVAVNDVSFQVGAGQLIGLIGPNGAGKTSLIDAITGYAVASGTVALDGQVISGKKPHERSRLGLGRTFQQAELFEDLTVLENVLVGTYRGGLRGVFSEVLRLRQAAPPELVFRLLADFGIEPLADRSVSDLSPGHRRLVSIVRALAGEPRVLLLDEPAAGLDSRESQELGRRLRALAAAGHSILLVDHDMDLVLTVCDSIEVLEFGQQIASGTPEEIRKDPKVIAAYLSGAGSESE